MEILALYIDNHFLYPNPIHLNFGGQELFTFKKEGKHIIIRKRKNDKYIRNFYHDSISNISAIVGNNGVGKTSLMRILNQEPKNNALAIYSHDGKIYIQNELEINEKCEFDYEIIDQSRCPLPLYYSGIIDFNLKDFNSFISESNRIKDSLSEYYFDTVLRQVFFLHNKGHILLEKFPELPFYENVSISINNVAKAQFLDSDFYKKATIGKSITEQLNMLWEYYGFESETMIHNNGDFLKNFELFILSLLVSEDKFAQTNNNSFSIGFDEVLRQEGFKSKLEMFLKKRLDNIDGSLFQILEETFGIKFEDVDQLIEKISADKLARISGGFDYTKIKNHAVQTIIRYHRIFRLYDFVLENYEAFQNPSDNSCIMLSVNNEETQSILKNLFDLYQKVYESLQYMTFEYRVFNVRPTKKISTGEQTLLNLFSSIYQFTLKREADFQKKDSYLLLLDEPDHGFHAVWKKKFIWTLIRILPELFSELTQNPKIQVIFTTHDALTLSDLPNSNISYLKRIDQNFIKVFNSEDPERPNKSFGANITDLLADSFFVEDGLMGDFAKEKINSVIEWIRELKKIDSNNSIRKGQNDSKNKEDYRRIIDLVDEPILRFKLDEMYYELFPEELNREDAKRQIEELAKRSGLNVNFND